MGWPTVTVQGPCRPPHSSTPLMGPGATAPGGRSRRAAPSWWGPGQSPGASRLHAIAPTHADRPLAVRAAAAHFGGEQISRSPSMDIEALPHVTGEVTYLARMAER